ncbi:MAG: FixH family protein [Pseudomonadota bacterium]
MNNSEQTKNTERKSKFWLGFILFFPLLSVVSGITMIYLANTSENSMVQDDWYKAGLAVNVDLAEEQWAQTQQIVSKLSIRPSNINNADDQQIAQIELTSKNAASVPSKSVLPDAAAPSEAAVPGTAILHGKILELSFEHVTDDARDVAVKLELDETDNTLIYRGNFNKKLSGTYRIHVKGILDYKPWALTQRFSVPNTNDEQWSVDLKASS